MELREKLWKKITNYPLLEAHWIVMGNFNFIEDLTNKLGEPPTICRGT